MARMHAIDVANLMSEATAPCMGPYRSKKSHNHCRDMHLLGATVAMAKEVAGITRRRRCQRSHQSRKHTRLHSRTWSYQKKQLHLVERERMVMYHIKRWSYQDRRKKVRTTGFLALQFTVKWLKALTLRVSL